MHNYLSTNTCMLHTCNLRTLKDTFTCTLAHDVHCTYTCTYKIIAWLLLNKNNCDHFNSLNACVSLHVQYLSCMVCTLLYVILLTCTIESLSVDS